MSRQKLHSINEHFYNKYGMLKQDFKIEIDDSKNEQLLIDIENNPEVFEKYFKQFAVNEIYFFREYLPEIFLQIIQNMENKNEVRIWSCGCSTGCEAYSMAVLLEYFFPDIKYLILASDINKSNLQIVKNAGPYTERDVNRFKNMPSVYNDDLTNIVKRYFYINENYFYVNDKVKAKIEVEELNLNLLDENKYIEVFDIIFCRNVLFYFNENAWDRIVPKLANALKIHGAFVVSPYETAKRKLLDYFDLAPVKSLTGVYYLMRRPLKNNINPAEIKNVMVKENKKLKTAKKIDLNDELKQIDELPKNYSDIAIINKKNYSDFVYYNFNICNCSIIFKFYCDYTLRLKEGDVSFKILKFEEFENCEFDENNNEYIFKNCSIKLFKKIIFYITGYLRSILK